VSHLIKVLAPSLFQMPGFGQRVEGFAVEQLITELAIE
jgi:hypothetical protein